METNLRVAEVAPFTHVLLDERTEEVDTALVRRKQNDRETFMSPQSQPVYSYAEIMRTRMKTGNTATGERLTIRDLAKRTGFSYEHVRKAYNGETTFISNEFNAAVCKELNLNEDDMWKIALREKLRAKFGSSADLEMPKDQRLVKALEQLEADERTRVILFAEGLVIEKQLQHAREEALSSSIAKGSTRRRK